MQTEQSRLALKRANEIRLHIAVLKKQLAAKTITINDVITDEAVKNLFLWDVFPVAANGGHCLHPPDVLGYPSPCHGPVRQPQRTPTAFGSGVGWGTDLCGASCDQRTRTSKVDGMIDQALANAAVVARQVLGAVRPEQAGGLVICLTTGRGR